MLYEEYHNQFLDYQDNNEHAIVQMMDAFAQTGFEGGMVADIDEFFVNTLERHEALFQWHIERRRGNHVLPLPSSDEVIAAGGTQNAYRPFYNHLSPLQWEQFMEQVRKSRMINENASLYNPQTTHIFAGMCNKAEFLGHLSARPLTPDVLATTKRDLVDRVGLPARPTMLRPVSEVSPTQASRWKVDTLQRIAAVAPNKKLILLDDSASTADEVVKINMKDGAIKIFQILFKGPLTIPVVNTYSEAKLAEMKYYGIYLADWDTMEAQLEEILNYA